MLSWAEARGEQAHLIDLSLIIILIACIQIPRVGFVHLARVRVCARMWACVLLCVSVRECKHAFVTPCVKIQSVPTDSSGVGGAVSVGTGRLSVIEFFCFFEDGNYRCSDIIWLLSHN